MRGGITRVHIKLYGKVISRTVVGDSGVRVGEGEGRGGFLPEVREFITDTKPRTNTTRVFFNGAIYFVQRLRAYVYRFLKASSRGFLRPDAMFFYFFRDNFF